MIFQASYVSTTMAMFQVDFFDSNGESMKGLEPQRCEKLL